MSVRSQLFSRPPNLSVPQGRPLLVDAFRGCFSLQARHRSLRLSYAFAHGDRDAFAAEVPLLEWASIVDRLDADILLSRSFG